MAAPVILKSIDEDDEGLTLTASGTFTDTQQTAALMVDVSTLQNIYPGVSAPKLAIESIDWLCDGSGAILVRWDATADVTAVTLEGTGRESYIGAPLQNTAGTGVTGDVLFTTTGFGSGDTYEVTIRFQKAQGFTIRPVCTALTAEDGKSGTYITGDEIYLKAVFDQVVFPQYGTAGVEIGLTSGAVKATYSEAEGTGSGTTALAFKYTVKETDQAGATHFTLDHIDGVLGSIVGGQSCVDSLPTLSVTGFNVNKLAAISSVALTDNHSGVYVTDDVIQVTVTYDKPITVTGIPQVPLTIGEGTKQASYVGKGNTAAKLVFEYTVAEEDVAEATAFDITGSIGLNGGTITNTTSVHNAALNLAASNTAAVTVN